MQFLISLPPSDNKRFILSHGRMIKSSICRRYEKEAVPLIRMQTAKHKQFAPTFEHQVIMRYTVTLSDKRRDASNIEKILKDVLTMARVWNDDKWVCPQLQHPIRIDAGAASVWVDIDYAP